MELEENEKIKQCVQTSSPEIESEKLLSLINKNLLDKTSEFYKQKQYSIEHQTVSLIISQKVSFTIGKNIRKKLFELTKGEEFVKNNMNKISNEQLVKIGIDSNKIKTIRNVLNVEFEHTDKYINAIDKINGIGTWTIKCLKIMFKTDPDIMLVEDLWIRKRLQELLRLNKLPTMSECNKLSNIWSGYRTIVSLFLWRIKPDGIKQLLQDSSKLTKEHFI